MKVQKLFEGKEEVYGVKIVTKDDISKTINFKTKDEMESYIDKMKKTLGSKIHSITKLYKENGEWGALKENDERWTKENIEGIKKFLHIMLDKLGFASMAREVKNENDIEKLKKYSNVIKNHLIEYTEEGKKNIIDKLSKIGL